MRQVTAGHPQLLLEVGDHLLGLPYGVSFADEVPVAVQGHGTGEEGESRAGLDDGGVGVGGGREEGGGGDAPDHGGLLGLSERS